MYVPEEVTHDKKKFILKELSETFHETTKHKMETEPDLERTMTICHVIEKMFALYHSYEKRKRSTIETTLYKCDKEIKHFNSQCF